ncbi:MAG: hypothetical protein QOH00_443 [Gaiellales bacterium]|nr:hypothetical protein [Gaiellales bacterium]
MKIALVSEHASPLAALGGVDAGGQNVHVAALAAALAARGAEITVYTRRDCSALPSQVILTDGVTVEHVTAGPASALPKDALWAHMPEFARRLAARWDLDRPDAVHAHFWMSGHASLEAAPPQVPVLQTFHALGIVKRRHQGDKDTSPAERIEIERTIARTCDRIIATCSDEAFELVRLGAERARITVIPCGVDLQLFAPAGETAARGPGPRLLVVGRLVERKGADDCITALAELPGCELVIAGGPDASALDGDPEVERLRERARATGVSDRVRFVGRVDHAGLPSLMRSADIALCVPWYEPFGIVPLEAMACGVPVVAAAVGGLCDTVVDGVTGLHVPPRKPNAVAGAVRRLLAQPELRRSMSASGVERAARYDWDRIADSTLRTYESVRTHGARLGEPEEAHA